VDRHCLSPAVGSVAAAKTDLRRKVSARRVARVRTDPDARPAAGRAVHRLLAETPELRALQAGDTVTAYLELATEVPLAATRAALAAAGVTVLVPRVLPDADLDWVRWTPDTPAPASRTATVTGTAEDLGPSALVAASVVLLPGIAGDRDGRRLGRGGGSYDRALGRLPTGSRRPWTCLVLYDDEVVDMVPVDVHDVYVDAVVTPGGLVRRG